MVQPGPRFLDGRGVGQHAHCPCRLGQITAGHNSWRLVIDAHFETCGTPVNELDGLLHLDGGDGAVDVLGYNVPSVQEADSHVLAIFRITPHHLTVGLETLLGDFIHT